MGSADRPTMKVMGLALAMLAAAGCTLVELVASPSPTAPIKPTPGPIVLQTLPGPPASPCPEAGIEGTLVEHPATASGLLDDSGAVRTPVVWPAGIAPIHRSERPSCSMPRANWSPIQANGFASKQLPRMKEDHSWSAEPSCASRSSDLARDIGRR
jgi:hypothetical protein